MHRTGTAMWKILSWVLTTSLVSSQLHVTHRGSYINAHVLLNLLNELRIRDKMRGLPSIFSLFRNEFINSILQ